MCSLILLSLHEVNQNVVMMMIMMNLMRVELKIGF